MSTGLYEFPALTIALNVKKKQKAKARSPAIDRRYREKKAAQQIENQKQAERIQEILEIQNRKNCPSFYALIEHPDFRKAFALTTGLDWDEEYAGDLEKGLWLIKYFCPVLNEIQEKHKYVLD
jgi:hypothetical protein